MNKRESDLKVERGERSIGMEPGGNTGKHEPNTRLADFQRQKPGEMLIGVVSQSVIQASVFLQPCGDDRRRDIVS